MTTEGFRRIVDASELEQREMRLLRAGGMLPSGGVSPMTSASPVSPVSPTSAPHSTRLLGALKSLPLVRRFCSSAITEPTSEETATQPTPAHAPALLDWFRRTGVETAGGGDDDAGRATTPATNDGNYGENIAGLWTPPERGGGGQPPGTEGSGALGDCTREGGGGDERAPV